MVQGSATDVPALQLSFRPVGTQAIGYLAYARASASP
jgi:hypothetical protein